MDKKDQRENVIIIKGEEKKPNSFTFGTYGHNLNVYKYWVLGATLICGIGGYLGISLVVNKSREVLTSSFIYNIPLIDDTNNNKCYYLDNTLFNYTEIASANTIRSVIKDTLDDNKNVKYANLNADSIIKNNSVNISLAKDSEGKNVSETSHSYVLTLQLGDFKNEDTGRNFIQDLVNYTKDKAVNISQSFSVDNVLSEGIENISFRNSIVLLEKEYTSILDTYDDLIKRFGTSFTYLEKTLSNHYASFINRYSSASVTVFDNLNGDLDNNCYVKYTVGQENEKIKELTKQGENDKAYLKSLLSDISNAKADVDRLATALGSTTSVSEKPSNIETAFLTANNNLSALEKKRTNVVSELRFLGYQVSDTYEVSALDATMSSPVIGAIQHLSQPTVNNWDADCLTFNTKLTTYCSNLISDLDPINGLTRSIYKSNSNNIYYSESGIATLSKHISNTLGGLVGVLLGFIASSLICTGLGINNDKKKKAEEKAVLSSDAVEIKPDSK